MPLSGLAFEAAQRVANLEKLELAASELSRDGRRSLVETLDALEEGFESDEEGDSPLADASRDAVRVMTIHKAKGLEARIVILADTALGRSTRGPRDTTAGMTLLPQGEFVRIDTPKFRNAAAIAASLDDARHEDAEDVRLLYVALTRARREASSRPEMKIVQAKASEWSGTVASCCDSPALPRAASISIRCTGTSATAVRSRRCPIPRARTGGPRKAAPRSSSPPRRMSIGRWTTSSA
jgi:ATP-dependent helicase/nuclease subunit A